MIYYAQYVERYVFRKISKNKVPIALNSDNSTVSLTNTTFVGVYTVGRVRQEKRRCRCPRRWR